MHLTGALEGGTLVFTVDNYCERLQELPFDRLFSVGYTTKQGGVHEGLGLSIVEQIASKYKGTVKAEPLDGSRIRFTVRIPHRAAL